MKKIVISSGHGTKVRGASGYIDEVDEAIRVMERTAQALRAAGAQVITYTDTVSTSQSENLDRIVDFHNAQGPHDVDVSCHFNAYSTTSQPMGCEVLYLTQDVLADDLSEAIASAGQFIDRGPKKRTDLAFLNGCEEPSVLLEICFVDSSADVERYQRHFESICSAIAQTITGETLPAATPKPPPPPALEPCPPTIGLGDRGSSVLIVQNALGAGEYDSEFGEATEDAVETYQQQRGLSVDGIVGPATWAQLNADAPLPLYPPPPLPPLPEALVREICEAALSSELAEYYWADRGKAPAGYIQGMAFAYAVMLRKLEAADPVAVITAQADMDDEAHDALTWYAAQFKALGMDNSGHGVETLRHLWVLLIGLGMRESSGQHCLGRDQSASNTTAETAEAGLFQTSWNAGACSSDFEKLLDEYGEMGACQQAGEALFSADVSCSQAEWSCYGSGDGLAYQQLAKAAPQFACETTALGARYLRQHWGPLNRKEVEIRIEADLMLQDIEALLGGELGARA
jgi:hypothetical protein